MARFRDRPTGELMVLMVATTVCVSIVATGTFIAVIVLVRPGVDVSVWVTRVTGLLNTMIGLLAGFLAGRTDTATAKKLDSGDDL